MGVQQNNVFGGLSYQHVTSRNLSVLDKLPRFDGVQANTHPLIQASSHPLTQRNQVVKENGMSSN